MPKLKKILGLALALTLALALAVPAAAGSITVKAPGTTFSLDGVTFNAYQLFSLTITDGQNDEYVYTINSDFAAFEFTYGSGSYSDETLRLFLSSPALDLNSNGQIDDADVVEALTGQLKAFITEATPKAGTAVGTAASVTIDSLGPGYYVVIPEDGLAALPILTLLTVATESRSVTIKADAPTIDKKVNTQSDSSGTWQDVADYNMGDTVPFHLTSKVPAMTGYDSYSYTVHDTMSDGLTFKNDVSVTVGGTAFTDFTVNTDPGDGCTFHIEFNAEAFVELTPGDAIEIFYSATLNSGAEIAPTGNPNTVYLEYSNDPYWDGEGEEPTGETPDDTVIVYTFQFEIVKVNSAGARLSGAQFVLYRGTAGSEEYAQITGNKITGWTSDAGAATTITVDGAYTISGLDAGTYFLEETVAPTGYNKLAEPIEVVITATYTSADVPAIDDLTITYNTDTTASDSDDSNDIVEILVLNNSGTIFPETGGIGTTIFTIVGITLMVGAAVVLIAKKKMSAKS